MAKDKIHTTEIMTVTLLLELQRVLYSIGMATAVYLEKEQSDQAQNSHTAFTLSKIQFARMCISAYV